MKEVQNNCTTEPEFSLYPVTTDQVLAECLVGLIVLQSMVKGSAFAPPAFKIVSPPFNHKSIVMSLKLNIRKSSGEDNFDVWTICVNAPVMIVLLIHNSTFTFTNIVSIWKTARVVVLVHIYFGI